MKRFKHNGIGENKKNDKTFEWYEKAALQGNSSAQTNLGLLYANGDGIEQNFERACEWLEKAALQGNSSAQANLGVLYLKGQGVKQNYEKAFEWFEKAALQDDPSGQTNLGALYLNGQGVKQNFEKAFEWYEKAALQGSSNAQFNLGTFYDNGQGVEQNYEKAFEWYEKAALQGDLGAQSNMGVLYLNGQGVKQNYEKAIEWFEKAALQGNSSAQSNMGVLYANGQGVKQNYKKAIEWFEKAASQDDSDAQFNMGVLYENGQGVEQSYKKAFEWYKKGALQGNSEAQLNLGKLYTKGQGVEQNYEKAFEWYEKAASQGNSDAQTILGAVYTIGQGIAQNYEKAFEWYKEAASQENSDAQCMLGTLYENGMGVEQNYENAFEWYEKAALQGDSDAQFSLGELYEFGRGVEQNDEKAFEWYKKAAVNGNASAQGKLDNSYLNEQAIDMSKEENNQEYEDFQYKSSACFNLDKDELRKLIQESLFWCGSKKKISETMTDVSEKYVFNVEFDMDFFVSALSTITKGKFVEGARRAAEKIASIKAISFTDEAIIISGKILRYSFLQICGKVWDFNEGQYKAHKLFIQYADEIMAISSNEADFLEEIINRIIRKREPDIQSYYEEILEDSDSPYIKKICIDILRYNMDCKEEFLYKYDAAFKLCQAICIWHSIRSVDDEQVKNLISYKRNVVKSKDAAEALEKWRTKNAFEKYKKITELLISAELMNFTLAYYTHLEVLDYYSSKKVVRRIKTDLVDEGDYKKLSEELYGKIQNSTPLNSFDCMKKGIEADFSIYNLYVKFWYCFVKKHQLTTAKKWADMLIDTNYPGINYGEIYYWYSKLYRDGVGETEKSQQKQEIYLKKAYNEGNGKAAFALSKFNMDKGDVDQATIFKNAAKKRGVTKSEDYSRMPTFDEILDGSTKIGQIEENIINPIGRIMSTGESITHSIISILNEVRDFSRSDDKSKSNDDNESSQ